MEATQARNQNFTLGVGSQKGALFSQKKLTTFFVVALKNLALHGSEHGRRSREDGGDKSPPEFGAGGLSPRFFMLQNFKKIITCITM